MLSFCRMDKLLPLRTKRLLLREFTAGYACVSPDEAHDFGYGLRSDQWGKGYATEACTAVVRELRSSRPYPFITATHDVLNPQSGRVMQKIGMTYRYSYKELWQPKNIPVVFRMYQLDFADGAETYLGYRDTFPQHWIEKL